METPDTTPNRRNRRRLLIPILLTLAAGSIGASAFSMALFTDSVAVGGNAFTTGTVDISASPASAVVTLNPMMPGDTVNGTLTMTNAGTAQLRYAMTSSSTNTDSLNLRDAITLTVKLRDVAADACTDFDGTQLFSGALSAAAFGSTAAGFQAGDQTLSAGASQKLCFRASFPSAATGPQGASTTATFTFTAEQTANNP